MLSGDARIVEKLRKEELLPLGSRLRARLDLEHATPDDLLRCLKHLLKTAGNASLMTTELMHALCDHAAGNYRILTSMAAELAASQQLRPASISRRCEPRRRSR